MTPTIHEYEPLARYVGWRIGGPARYFAAATEAHHVAELVTWARERELPVFVLGGGTNILIADSGFPGLVIRNRALTSRIEQHGDELILHAGAGAPMAGTARRMAGQGIGGLIWAEGLPGTIGGAVYGNAGCYGGDTAGALVSATLLMPDGRIEEWPRERFAFGYRTSLLKQTAGAGSRTPIVLEARLRLHRDDPEKLARDMAAIAAERRSKTPSGSSCGSSFKNPPGTSAGRLLDLAGLKGTRVGGAVVAERHANYIVNTGGATAADVLRLTEIMRERVLQECGVELELEVQLVGDFAIGT
jgi:UDP-N-acetylmuramate dehydrogenase